MQVSFNVKQIYETAKGNKWYFYFALFCRVVLAFAFIISAIVKIRGERFASGLLVNNPMGHYLEALYHTEYYYTFIGISQLVIALLLLFPKTAHLGALFYFPVILNICVLAYGVRFEGTRITTFMVLASLYLLFWYYDRLKYILPLTSGSKLKRVETKKMLSNRFPFLFFLFVIAMIAAVIFINLHMYDIRPGNSPEECTNGCPGNSNPRACEEFCDCIYVQGKPLRDCLNAYNEKIKK